MTKRGMDPDNPWTFRTVISKGGHQNPNVNTMMAYCIENETFTHWLKMDDDLVPDDGLIDRLLEMNKPFIGVAIGIFRESHDPPAFAAVYNIGEDKRYKEIDLAKNPQGECDYVGGGCVMYEYGLLKRLYDEAVKTDIPVWYYDAPFKGQFEGSDERICTKLKSMGVQPHYDATFVIPQHTDVLVSLAYGGGLKTVDLTYSQKPEKAVKDG